MPEKKIGVAVVTNSGGQSGVVLNFLAASIYERLLGKPDRNQLPTLVDSLNERRKQFVSGVAERAKRPWMLKHPNEAYVGRYENALFGPMVIEQRGDKLVASLENLSAVFEAYTEPESARIEMPPGNGSVLRFAFDGDAVASLKWDDEIFQRVK